MDTYGRPWLHCVKTRILSRLSSLGVFRMDSRKAGTDGVCRDEDLSTTASGRACDRSNLTIMNQNDHAESIAPIWEPLVWIVMVLLEMGFAVWRLLNHDVRQSLRPIQLDDIESKTSFRVDCPHLGASAVNRHGADGNEISRGAGLWTAATGCACDRSNLTTMHQIHHSELIAPSKGLCDG